MNNAIWAIQLFAGVFFVAVGVLHFIVPEGLPANFAWMYDLSPTLHLISGTAEVLGGLGLILPAVTRIRPDLVPLAAAGLAVVMLGAIAFHIGRGEASNAAGNALWVLAMAFVAWGRWMKYPIAPRGA